MKHKNLLMLAVAAAVSLVSFAAQAAGFDVAGFFNAHRDAMAGLVLMGSVALPNGSIVSIAASYGPKKNITLLSNASPAQATFETGHLIALNDIIEVTSGWARLTNRILKAGTPAGDVIPLIGLDTTDTQVYQIGGGVGSAREVLTWTQLSQILESTSNGGEQQFLTYQFLEDDGQKRIPTVKNASGLTFKIADDASLPGYQLASVANDDRLPRAVKIALPSGGVLLYNCFISLNKTPTLTINELMSVEVTLSLLADPLRY